ncbi:hypothetical protein Dimus_005036 [Dionaea muscipula]
MGIVPEPVPLKIMTPSVPSPKRKQKSKKRPRTKSAQEVIEEHYTSSESTQSEIIMKRKRKTEKQKLQEDMAEKDERGTRILTQVDFAEFWALKIGLMPLPRKLKEMMGDGRERKCRYESATTSFQQGMNKRVNSRTKQSTDTRT